MCLCIYIYIYRYKNPDADGDLWLTSSLNKRPSKLGSIKHHVALFNTHQTCCALLRFLPSYSHTQHSNLSMHASFDQRSPTCVEITIFHRKLIVGISRMLGLQFTMSTFTLGATILRPLDFVLLPDFWRWPLRRKIFRVDFRHHNLVKRATPWPATTVVPQQQRVSCPTPIMANSQEDQEPFFHSERITWSNWCCLSFCFLVLCKTRKIERTQKERTWGHKCEWPHEKLLGIHVRRVSNPSTSIDPGSLEIGFLVLIQNAGFVRDNGTN